MTPQGFFFDWPRLEGSGRGGLILRSSGRGRVTQNQPPLPAQNSRGSAYFDVIPADFFAPLQEDESLYHKLCEQLRSLSDDDLKKIATFIDRIRK